LVAGAVIIAGLAVVLFIFREDITNFLTLGVSGLGKSLSEAFGGAGEAISGAGEAAREGVEMVGTSIFDAGAGAGRAFADAQAIKNAEAEILKAAKDSGFETVEEFNLATDSGSVVIGGEKTVVDFGLIGDVIPTNPSQEFIESAEGQRLIMTNADFKKIVEAQIAQEGTTPEGVSLSLAGTNQLTLMMEENPSSSTQRFGGRRRR